jgi:hypothetical protein
VFYNAGRKKKRPNFYFSFALCSQQEACTSVSNLLVEMIIHIGSNRNQLPQHSSLFQIVIQTLAQLVQLPLDSTQDDSAAQRTLSQVCSSWSVVTMFITLLIVIVFNFSDVESRLDKFKEYSCYTLQSFLYRPEALHG